MKKKLFVVFMTIAMAVSLVCGMSFMTASASNELTLGDTVTPGANNSVEINWQNMTFTGDDEAELGINDFANITVTRGSTVYNPDFVRQIPSRQTFKIYCLNTGYNFASAEQGDLLTIKSGTTFSRYPDITVSADINYIYTGSKWIKGNTIPTEPAEPETPVVNDEISRIDYTDTWGGGLLVGTFSVDGGYAVNPATNPVDMTPMKQYVEVTKANGTKLSDVSVEAHGTSVFLVRGQGYTPEKGDEVKFLTGFTYGACHLGEDVRFIYSGSSYVKQLPESAISEIEAIAVYYDSVNWGGTHVQFELSLADAGAYTLFSAGDKDHLSYVNAYGEVKPLADCTYVNSKNFIARLGSAVSDVITDPYYPMVGDIFTIKKGFLLTHGEVGERINKDFPFIYNGSAFIPYVPATHDVTEFNITNDAAKNEVYAGATLQLTYSANAGALYTPKFTSSDDTVATVSASGLITGVKEGNATITAKVGSIEKTFAVVVHPALTVEEVRFDRSYTIMAEKGSAAAIPSNFTVVKVFSNGSESEPIALTADNARFKTAVDTSVIPGDPMGRMKVTIVVTIDGEEYELDEYVRVYEVADLEITEVAPVEWFLYYSFIEYPNSTFNVCNITSVADLPDFADHIEYYRDGEKISVGLYILGKGNICVMPARADGKTVEGNSDLDNDNFSERLYKQGDTIKLIAGLTVYGHTGLAPTATDTGAYSDDKGMLYKDAVLKNDVMYRFTGNSWSLYIPYTDMEVASETLEVALGTDNATVGASRIPANATTGKFTYVSSDTTVLTVAENGKINALKEGAATITVTLSSEDGETITKTVSVNVVNKIIRLEISGKLTVKPGTETLDLSKVKGYYVYGNGDRVEATDLANAIYVGYDPDEKGEQNVVIRVTHEGQQYTANLIVEVKAATQKKGCKSGVASASALSLLGLGVIALAKKKRK